MEELLREDPFEWKVDLDRFFRTGYVIELGEGMYYQKYKDRKIICSSLTGAKQFEREADAETFVYCYLGYVGLKVILCRVGWVLLSLESESMETEQYWDGSQFTGDIGKPLVFPGFQEAKACQKKSGLLNVSMIDLRVFRGKEIVMAA